MKASDTLALARSPDIVLRGEEGNCAMVDEISQQQERNDSISLISNKRLPKDTEDGESRTRHLADEGPPEESVAQILLRVPEPVKRHAAAEGKWTPEEHQTFLIGLDQKPRLSWSEIARLVGTRTVKQVRTHAQKYYQKQERRRQRLERYKAQLQHIPSPFTMANLLQPLPVAPSSSSTCAPSSLTTSTRKALPSLYGSHFVSQQQQVRSRSSSKDSIEHIMRGDKSMKRFTRSDSHTQYDDSRRQHHGNHRHEQYGPMSISTTFGAGGGKRSCEEVGCTKFAKKEGFCLQHSRLISTRSSISSYSDETSSRSSAEQTFPFTFRLPRR